MVARGGMFKPKKIIFICSEPCGLGMLPSAGCYPDIEESGLDTSSGLLVIGLWK